MGLTHLLQPSGGLIYHWRAMNYAHNHWRPFKIFLETWLRDWHVDSAEMVLIGPSGGYCLPPEFLMRFKRLVAFDPDPLAKPIFLKRIERFGLECEIEWHTLDFFKVESGNFSLDTPFLFCNVLGQLPLNRGVASYWETQIQTRIQNRPWASFHDRLSGTLRPYQYDSRTTLAPSRRLSNHELLKQFYPQRFKARLNDHDWIESLPKEHHYCYATWELRPRQYHLIEAFATPFKNYESV